MRNREPIIKDEQLTWKQVDNYFIPVFEDEQPEVELGTYAQMREKWLKTEHHALWTAYLMEWTMAEKLYENEQRALVLEEKLTRELMVKEGVTDELKAKDQMKWVGMMNSIKARVEEIVLNEVVYTL